MRQFAIGLNWAFLGERRCCGSAITLERFDRALRSFRPKIWMDTRYAPAALQRHCASRNGTNLGFSRAIDDQRCAMWMPTGKDVTSRPEKFGGSWWCGLGRAEFAARAVSEAARMNTGNPESDPGSLTGIPSPLRGAPHRRSGTRVPDRLDLGRGFGPVGFGYHQTAAYFTGHQAPSGFVPPSLK